MVLIIQDLEPFRRLYNPASSITGISPLKEDDIVKVAARARFLYEENFLGSENFQVEETKTKNTIGEMEATTCMHNGNASIEGCKVGDLGEVRLNTESRELKCPGVSSDEIVRLIGNKDNFNFEARKGLNVLVGSLADGFHEQLVQLLTQVAHVELCPLVAITGGIAAQEVIKVHILLFYACRYCSCIFLQV